ncbi:MAG: DUF5686 and carboxypeptidase regulatory-like domain-containing protein [Cytophagales bacterium]|nr:DUF5686 and carboxypeptidase regulatory-like domain-containing protein [Cytophagales bacterium]
MSSIKSTRLFPARLNLLIIARWIIAVAFLGSFQVSQGQETIVKGRVIDAETGDPIPFVNVVFLGTTVGITTDFDGFYQIKTDMPVDSISASYIGYITRIKPLKRGSTQNINFQLTQDLVNLQEVVFVAGENPAYEIIRHVVENKDKHDRRSLSAYEYESYNKTEFDINNLTEKLRSQKMFRQIATVMDSLVQIAGEDGKPVLPIFISESISKFYVKHNPKVQKEYIINTKVSGVGIDDGSLTSQLIGSTFQQYNFYMNWVNLVNKEFISPIADGWKTYYEYSLEDSLTIGSDFCYKIDFWPKSEQDLAFTGTMWITKGQYALKQVDLSVNKKANLNYIEKLKIQQELAPSQAGPWIPSKTRVVIDVGELTKNTPSLVAKFYSSNKDFMVNKPHSPKFYETMIELDEQARLQPKGYWEKNRHDSLTATEKNVYMMIDTLKTIPVVKTFTDVVKTAFSGYLKVGKFDLGPYVRSFARNEVEGIRLGMGARTNIDFSDKWVFQVYGAYGFSDERWKYLASVDYIVSRKPWTKIGIEHRRDMDQVWLLGDDVENSSIFFAFSQFGNITRPFDHIENTINFETQIRSGLIQKVTFKQQDFSPLFPFQYYKDPGNNESEIGSGFSTSEISLETRFAKDEIFIQNDNNRISLGTLKWPAITIRYTHGFDNFLGSDFSYDKLNFNISQSLKMGFFGVSRYSISGGYIFSQLPYPLLKSHIGNESPFYAEVAYNLMDFFEFVSDRYLSLRYRHSFEGFILNRIPLMKKLKWRLVGNANIIYGGLRDENLNVALPEFDETGIEIPAFRTLGNTPYIELGYGIENIFKIIRVDAFHRLTYLDAPEVRKFGVKISFQFIL